MLNEGICVPGEELAMVHLQIIKLAKELFNIWYYKKSSTFWGSAEWGSVSGDERGGTSSKIYLKPP